MTDKEKNKYVRVYLEWGDTVMAKTAWINYEDFKNGRAFGSQTFKTIGYLIKETDKEYSLCHSIHLEDGIIKEVSQIITIPKGCVIKCEYLENDTFK